MSIIDSIQLSGVTYQIQGEITVDAALDSGSTNPVANSAITTALDNKVNVVDNEVPDYNVTSQITYQGGYPSQSETASTWDSASMFTLRYNFFNISDTNYTTTAAVIDPSGNITTGSATVEESIRNPLPDYINMVREDEEFSRKYYFTAKEGYRIAHLDIYSSRFGSYGAIIEERVETVFEGGQSADVIKDVIEPALINKQDQLVSGTNIKTINNTSILGSGNIDIQGGGKAIEAGRGISITTGETADTVSVSLPISAGTGTNSIAEGSDTTASGYSSHAEGANTRANGYYSHAEGYSTTASTDVSHAEGSYTRANSYASHAEGGDTTANGMYSHAEGYETKASGNSSHAEGADSNAIGDYSHAEGHATASGDTSHAEGTGRANGSYSHAEGSYTVANNQSEHASGRYNISSSASTTFGDSGNTLFSVGNGTANNARHNAFEIRQNGDIYISSGNTDIKLQDHLGGGGSVTVDSTLSPTSENPVQNKVIYNKIDEVEQVTAAALNELNDAINGKQPTLISGTNIKTINNQSILGSGNIDIQGGSSYTAGRGISIANNTIAVNLPISAGTGNNSIIEGNSTTASGSSSHAEGESTKANGNNSHAEGYNTTASGSSSHAEGIRTIANNQSEHASGQYNVSNKASTTFGNSGNTLFSVGNGTSNNTRHNAFEIRQNGDIYLTKDGQDVKLQDQLGGSSITVDTALDSGSTNPVENRVIYNKIDEVEQVTAAGLNALNDNFGGLKLVKLTQAEYNALVTKDSSTLYIIVN